MESIIIKLCIAVTMLSLSISTSAYGFEVDGIKYTKITTTEASVMGADDNIKGTLAIPPTVKLENGTEYSVVSIAANFSWNGGPSSILQIPESIEIIETEIQGSYGGYTFYYGLLTNALVGNIMVSPENKYYSSQDGVLFSKDGTTLYRYPRANPRKEYTIPAGVVEIFDRAVCDVDSLEYVVIPNSVNSIRKSAFSSCRNLRGISMSESIQIIHTDAFEDCKISYIDLPKTLEFIGDDAFDCYDPTSNGGIRVNCYAVKPPELLQYKDNEQPFSNEILMYGELHIPQGTKLDYKYAPGWIDFRSIHDDLISEDVVEDSTANVVIFGTETFSTDITFPKGYEAEFKIDEADNWHIYSIIYNNEDVTHRMEAATFKTPPLDGINTLRIIMSTTPSSFSKQIKDNKIKVIREGEFINIQNADTTQELTIYNIQGKLLYRGFNHYIHLPEENLIIINIEDNSLKLFI